jgi:hypothetical protein
VLFLKPLHFEGWLFPCPKIEASSI